LGEIKQPHPEKDSLAGSPEEKRVAKRSFSGKRKDLLEGGGGRRPERQSWGKLWFLESAKESSASSAREKRIEDGTSGTRAEP